MNATTPAQQAATRREQVKQAQLELIQETNPAPEEDYAWIRSTQDIKTFAEALLDPDYKNWQADGGFDEDYLTQDVIQALKTGRITVYSSYPIKAGVFVTPSRMEAWAYSSTGWAGIHSKQVPIDDVAWIDPTQGQYAPQRYAIQVYNQNRREPSLEEQYLAEVAATRHYTSPQTDDATRAAMIAGQQQGLGSAAAMGQASPQSALQPSIQPAQPAAQAGLTL